MFLKYINIDATMMVLNVTSFGTLALAWTTEHLAGLGGFVVMISVAALNFSKAYINYRKGRGKIQ
jgi:hypothetical protein